MEENNKGFLIFGRVIEQESSEGIPGLTVKAVDKDWLFDDLLGTAVTDEDGAFTIRYEGKDFRELFFDNRPDIYLKIKDPDGDLIFSTKEKVRYQADTTEEFIVKIPKAVLPPPPVVSWNKEESQRLKIAIVTNEKVMRALSKAIQSTFRKFELNLAENSYIFEPRVFEISSDAGPVIMKKAKESLWKLLSVQQRFNRDFTDEWEYGAIRFKCLPACGPLDPRTLRILEKYRMSDWVADDPVPIHPSERLMQRIVGNKALLNELSTAIFEVLKNNKITFKANQGCVFTPVVFDTPAYAQIIGEVANVGEVEGFGPQIVSDSNPLPPSVATGVMRLRPEVIADGSPMPPPKLAEAGLLNARLNNELYIIPALRIKGWWWVGIPAPEMLKALDVVREFV